MRRFFYGVIFVVIDVGHGIIVFENAHNKNKSKPYVIKKYRWVYKYMRAK